ncbi:pyruvate, phosphate dikinase [Halosquirtibacter xylanolyticus]|uniref:pyruvate, phosphate dikinase n=1 Tax=Halosquirtibacter xylanolyticus TaxID=3374599 RepID=UPI003749B704|nr:pyruvate, phosphate dikinase [Prolixibacteraceae bacterium]
MKKFFYTFGNGEAEGKASMRDLLGGKGANLAEMNRIGVPVPPGVTITTDVCTLFTERGSEETMQMIWSDLEKSIHHIEQLTHTIFGDKENPCLVSVRSGARVSMPGMMDTILNLGLNDQAVEGLAKKTGNERFAWDSYRRFIQMYGDVVMGLKPESKEDIDPFEEIIEAKKEEKQVSCDNDLTTDDLKALVTAFKEAIYQRLGEHFPTDPWQQLKGAIEAVFKSWMNDRAILYRRLHQFPAEWGTAVNIQAMVFGNMGDNSATGVAFTRDAATGENLFNGEYLVNAQGEDVVAGTRTPQQITKIGSQRWAELQEVDEATRASQYPSLEEAMPKIYNELDAVQQRLEDHYCDMQDLEFTIQEGKLWILQTRNGKRTGPAMVKIALDLMDEGKITEKEAVMSVDPAKLDELLHPVFKQEAVAKAEQIGKGLPASPGAATGQVVFFADEVAKYEKAILVRIETSPEDLEGMHLAQGILTARGGMTSHAAVVARGMGKCCISGAGDIHINYKNRSFKAEGCEMKEGEWISIDGSTGLVYKGMVATKAPTVDGNFARLMAMSDKYSEMKVRTNADSPRDAQIARDFGAQGIGLCRTEHMFFDGERIKVMREMILAKDVEGRCKALNKLLPFQREDFEGILKAMEGYGVTIRLLDPPLHEFVPHQEAQQRELSEELGITMEEIQNTIHNLEEFNPMLGHRGCRLGNTYPEITEMQARAIIEATIQLKKEGVDARPEIMVPLIGTVKELEMQVDIIHATAKKVFEESGMEVDYQVGTMIEIPRAALTADKVAEVADFFSFGTNDLTQMTFGYSRDDVSKFLPIYLEKGLLKNDPFEVLDQEGVGQLVRMGTEKGRSTKPNLKVGICGEHGGEPSSVMFCNTVGMDYVSCSPYRVPIARLAAAHAMITQKKRVNETK